MDYRRKLFTFAAAAFIALLLPLFTASAQSNDPWWSRGRNRDDRYNRHYNSRALREAVRRVEERSDDFQDRLDSALDRSRYDDTQREDRINGVGREFRDAARRLRDRFRENDIYRSESDARQLLRIASRIDRFLSRNRLDGRVISEWSRMRSDLNLIADAYNFRNGGYDRDDDYRRNRPNRRFPNDRGWRWPF